MTLNELENSLIELNNAFYSGGANGADRHFTFYAMENGFETINFSFKGHNHNVPDDTVLEIPSHILSDKRISDQLVLACKSLGRSIPKPGSYIFKLLARNRFQIFNTDRVYCMSPLKSPTQVDGGTAWAVQMYIDSCENPEVYCYDIFTSEVYSYNSVLKEFVQVFEVPTPHGNWTGIGSRRAQQKDLEHFKTFFKD